MVVDNQRQLIGLIDARDTIALIQNDKEHKVQRLDSIVQKNVATTTANTSLNKLMEQFAQTSMPVAVLDDDKRLKGIVIRGAVLAAMAGTEAE